MPNILGAQNSKELKDSRSAKAWFKYQKSMPKVGMLVLAGEGLSATFRLYVPKV